MDFSLRRIPIKGVISFFKKNQFHFCDDIWKIEIC